MKFSVVAALLVVLAVAHGSEAASLQKRDIQSELERIKKFITDMSAAITTSAKDVVERVKNLESAMTAQTYIATINQKFKPLADKVVVLFQEVKDQTQALIPRH